MCFYISWVLLSQKTKPFCGYFESRCVSRRDNFAVNTAILQCSVVTEAKEVCNGGVACSQPFNLQPLF